MLSTQLFGQTAERDFFTISGYVKSGTDSSGIGYADVYVRGTATGTVCNTEGQFELKLPVQSIKDSIIVSAVGYRTVALHINKDSALEIFLNESVQYLNEVVINSNSFDSGTYILNTAIEFIKFNYSSKKHLLEGFFRELSLKDTIYTRLMEAAIVVQENGYDKPYFKGSSVEEIKTKVKVIEIRKSDDFRESSWIDKISVALLGERNELYMLLRGNYIKILGKKSDDHFLSKQNLNRNLECTYEGRSELNGVPVYIITLKTPAPTGSFRIEHLKLYINQFDYAIQKIEHTGLPNPASKQIKDHWLIEGKYFDRLEITYRKITNKYYPTFIHVTRSIYGASATVKDEHGIQKQYTDILFLVTGVYEDDFKKIKGRDIEEHDEDIYEKEFPYNEDFWSDYNTVKLNPLERGSKDLEKKKALKDQFKGK